MNEIDASALDALLIFVIFVVFCFAFYILGDFTAKNNGIYFENNYEMQCILANQNLTYKSFNIVNSGLFLKCNYEEGSIIYEINSFKMNATICDWCANTITR